MSISPWVWAGLIVTPVMISAGQVLFKMTGMRLAGRPGSSFFGVLLDPYLLTALVIYGAGTLIWISVLRHLTLSQAYPVMAMTFVLVPLASVAFFGEALGLRYWIGAALIITGMIVISS